MKMPPYVTFNSTCRDTFETCARILAERSCFSSFMMKYPALRRGPGRACPCMDRRPLDTKTKDSRD